MNELDFIVKMPITKTEQKSFADRLISYVMEGEENPVIAIIKARAFFDSLKQFIENDQIKDCVIREIEKNGKECCWNGATLSLKEMGVKYDYSNCNDPVYNMLIGKKKELEIQIKEREAFLKCIPEGTTTLNEDTGEIIKLYPAIRMASYSYSLTFPRK